MTRIEYVLVTVAVFIAVALRFYLLSESGFSIDSDEAIVGLMAKHLLEGQGIPVFYYGQHYMGSLEPLMVAGAFALFGQTNAVLFLVPVLFAAALVVVMYLIGRRLGGIPAGVLTALYFAFSPHALTVWSSKPRGGFIEVVFIIALILYLTILTMDRGPRWARTALVGVLAGVGWWVNNQVLFVFAPLGVGFLLATSSAGGWRTVIHHGALGLIAFFIGSAPFWWYNITHDFASFGLFSFAGEGAVYRHLVGVFVDAIPILLGAEGFWDARERFGGATWLAWALLVVVAVTPLLLRRGRDSAAWLLLLFVFSCIGIFSLSSFGYLSEAPRYLLPLYVGLVPLLFSGLVLLGERAPIVAVSGVMGAWLLVGVSLFSTEGLRIPGEPFVFKEERAARDHEELYAFLDQRGISWIRTNYWIGYRAAFETGERVRFRTFQVPFQERIEEYVAESPPPELLPLVLVPGQASLVERGLAATGIAYEQGTASGYVVLYNLRRQEFSGKAIPVARLRASASDHPDRAGLVLDGDVTTRWGSGRAQRPEMWFEITFAERQAVNGIELDLGPFVHDAPRSLHVIGLDCRGGKREIISTAQWQGVGYLYDRSSTVKLPTPRAGVLCGLRFEQVGSDPVFDWSIAEVRIYRPARS